MLFLQTGKPFAREAVNRGRLCCEHACRPGLPSEKSHFAYDCALRHPAQFMLLIFACPGEDGDGPFCYNIDGICRASRKIKRGPVSISRGTKKERNSRPSPSISSSDASHAPKSCDCSRPEAFASI